MSTQPRNDMLVLGGWVSGVSYNRDHTEVTVRIDGAAGEQAVEKYLEDGQTAWVLFRAGDVGALG